MSIFTSLGNYYTFPYFMCIAYQLFFNCDIHVCFICSQTCADNFGIEDIATGLITV